MVVITMKIFDTDDTTQLHIRVLQFFTILVQKYVELRTFGRKVIFKLQNLCLNEAKGGKYFRAPMNVKDVVGCN